MTKMKTRVKAYAKINLHLDVTGIREDGYHNIQSIMHSVSLCDMVDIEIVENKVENKEDKKIVIECDKAGVPLDEKNIAYKAARCFLDKAQKDVGVIIKIKKNIPMAAGLAGGSADGAAVLVGLNKLFDGALTPEELYLLGATLGADVPFCIACGCYYTEGIGDKLFEIPSVSEETILVIACGGEGVSTPAAYGLLDKKYNNFADYKAKDIEKIKECIVQGKNDFYNYIFNIFEEPIANEREAVKNAKNVMLVSGANAAMMSGSGPSVFGIFEELSSAENAVSILKEQGYFATVAYPTHKREL